MKLKLKWKQTWKVLQNSRRVRKGVDFKFVSKIATRVQTRRCKFHRGGTESYFQKWKCINIFFSFKGIKVASSALLHLRTNYNENHRAWDKISLQRIFIFLQNHFRFILRLCSSCWGRKKFLGGSFLSKILRPKIQENKVRWGGGLLQGMGRGIGSGCNSQV